MSKYEEIMDQIVVTDEMRDRILQNIRRQSSHSHTTRFDRNQLYILAAAAVLIVVCGVTFGVSRGDQTLSGNTVETELAQAPEAAEVTESAADTAESAAATDTTSDAGNATADTDGVTESAESSADTAVNSGAAVAAGWQAEEYDSAEALSEAVGFTITDIPNLPITATETSYIAIMGDLAEILYDDADGNEICYRKSPGTEDNSGDYNTYTTIVDASVGDSPLTLSGNDDQFHLATWTDGTYSYSINVSNGCDLAELQAMVEALQ